MFRLHGGYVDDGLDTYSAYTSFRREVVAGTFSSTSDNGRYETYVGQGDFFSAEGTLIGVFYSSYTTVAGPSASNNGSTSMVLDQSVDQGVAIGFNLDFTVQIPKAVTTTVTTSTSQEWGTYTQNYTASTSAISFIMVTGYGVNPYGFLDQNYLPIPGSTGKPQDGDYSTITNFLRTEINGAQTNVNGVASNWMRTQYESARANFFYEANTFGSLGPRFTPANYLGDYAYAFRFNQRQQYDVVSQNFQKEEWLYTFQVDGNTVVDQPAALWEGGGKETFFENEYGDESVAIAQTNINTPTNVPGLLVLPLQQPFEYVEFTPQFKGINSHMRTLIFNTSNYNGDIFMTFAGNQLQSTYTRTAELTFRTETLAVPYLMTQESFKLDAGDVITEENKFISFYTMLGRPYQGNRRIAGLADFHSTQVIPGDTRITNQGVGGFFTYRTVEYMPFSYSKLYPQVFTYDEDASVYSIHNYSAMEPYWSKYNYFMLYRNTNADEKPAMINLFYGLYTLFLCDEGNSTVDLTTAVSGVFTTLYGNTDFDVMISYSPLLEIKKCDSVFWTSDITNSLGATPRLGGRFFGTWSVGVAEGQTAFVIPVIANKYTPPENLLDYWSSQFTPITDWNNSLTSQSANTNLNPLLKPTEFLNEVEVSRAYSNFEAYY